VVKWGVLDVKKIILIFSIFLMVIGSVKISLAQEEEIIIDIEIIPRGAITGEYNVVGDIFHYNVILFNNFLKEHDDNFTIEILDPNNKIIHKEEFTSTVIPAMGWMNLTPIIKTNKTEDVLKIWPFEISGDYSIKICSVIPNMRFVKKYTIKKEGFLPSENWYSNYGCFTHYFSVMPEWQYSLFKKEFSAAEEALRANKKSLEANQKLVDLTVDLDNATKIMSDATQNIEWATWIMVVVAVLTLVVAFIKRA